MLKNLDIWNYRGLTRKDQSAMKKTIKKDIEMYIDDNGMVYNEANAYIADAVYDSQNGVGIEVQNEAWGGARKNAGRKKMIVPPGARKRVTSPLTDEDWERVKNYIKKIRKI